MEHLLTYRGTIRQTGAATGRDSYGKPVLPTTSVTGIACRYSTPTNKFMVDSKGRNIAIQGIVYFKPDEDVSPGDVVIEIVTAMGDVLSDDELEVIAIDKATNMDSTVYQKAYVKKVK